MNLKTITSEQNPLVRDVRRANLRGTVTEEGYCLAETFHLLDEALRSDCEIGAVIAAKPSLRKVQEVLEAHPNVPLVSVADELFDHLISTETNQGVLTLVRPPAWKPEQLFAGVPLLLVLDGVQDPGNAGTMLRAAEAFGATGAILLKGTASPYSPKTVRATAGSLFRLPLLTGLTADEAGSLLRERSVTLLAAMPGNGPLADESDLRKATAFAIGSEGQGVSEALQAHSELVRIATQGVESLNAALAAGVLLYEAHRQRRKAGA